MVPALVLTAGLGTRLRPLSLVRAKAALPVAGETLARRVLRWLAGNGVREALLNLHHLPESIAADIGDGSDLGVAVRYSWEPVVLGSAGGPRRAVDLLDGSTFLIVNGDTLTDVDLRALLDDHARSGALITLALIPNEWPQKYGGVRLDEHGQFAGVVPRGATEPSFHFIGVQAAEPAAFATLADGQPHESIAALYPALASAHAGAVRGFVTRASFADIGTPADYLATSLLLARGDETRLHGAAVRVEAGARIERSVVWDNVVIGHGALVRECVVADDVVIPGDTAWHGVTIRVASASLVPGERIVSGLAIADIDQPAAHG